MTTSTEVRERPILFSGEMIRAILAGRKTQTRRVVVAANSEFSSAPPAFWAHADFKTPNLAYADGQGSGSEYLHVPAHDDRACETCREWGWEGSWHRLRSRMAPAYAWDQVADPSMNYIPPASRLWVRETFQVETNRDVGQPDYVPPFTDGRPINRHNDESYGEWWDQAHYAATDPCPGLDFGEDEPVKRWQPSIHMPRWASRITLEITEVRVERLQDLTEVDAGAEGIGEAPIHGRVLVFRDLWNRLNEARGHGWDVNPWVWAVSFKRVEA